MSIFKVSTARQAKNIISIPDVCAYLQTFNEDTYQYLINIQADPLAAVQTGAFIVKILVLSENTVNARRFSYFRDKSPEEIVENLRRIDGLVKDESRSTTNSSLVLVGDSTSQKPPEIDLSSYISNNDLQLLKRGILPTKTRQKIVTKSVATLQAENANRPVMNYNSNNSSLINGYGPNFILPNNVKEQMTDLLYEGKIDPASLWKPTNTYVSTRKTFGGLKPLRSYVDDRGVQNDSRKLNIVASQLSNPRNLREQKEIPGEEYIQTVEYETYTQINAGTIINIPRTTIGKNNFILRFEVCDTSGKLYQIAEKTVLHGINVSDFMPTIPPKVETIGVAKPGKVIFNITQLDPYAVGVLVYRRQINPVDPLMESAYRQVADIPTRLVGGARMGIYTDTRVYSVNNYIYRFVPYTVDGVKSSIFTSIAVKLKRGNILPEEKVARVPSNGVIDYQFVTNGIQINIRNYPANVIQLKLYRRNLLTKQKVFNLLFTKFIDSNNEQGYSLVDQSVKLYNIYEYRVDVVYKNGTVQTLNNTLKIEYNPVVDSAALCEIQNIQTGVQGGRMNVSFDIEYKLQEQNFELLRRLLKEQNLLAEYQNEVSLNRENIKTFLSYSVLRFNMSTGELENFGIIPSTNFSDAQFGPVKNVKPLNASNTYRYIVTVYTRSPDTLFENLERTVSSEVTGTGTTPVTREYTFKPYKWLNPLILRTGNIISKDKHPEFDLAQGPVVDIKYVNISFNEVQYPIITNIAANKISPGSIVIEWKVKGSLSKIDHFIVKNNVSGIKNVIGSAHNVSSNGAYKFKYNLLSEEAGSVTFSIIPVYFDYTIGTETVSNTLVI